MDDNSDDDMDDNSDDGNGSSDIDNISKNIVLNKLGFNINSEVDSNNINNFIEILDNFTNDYIHDNIPYMYDSRYNMLRMHIVSMIRNILDNDVNVDDDIDIGNVDD